MLNLVNVHKRISPTYARGIENVAYYFKNVERSRIYDILCESVSYRLYIDNEKHLSRKWSISCWLMPATRVILL